jgi:tetratricopeptide (TPR) repeat protein
MNRFKRTFVLTIIVALIGGCATTREKVDPLELARHQFDAGNADKGFEILEDAILNDRHSLILGNYYRAQCTARAKEDRAINFLKKLSQDTSSPNEVYYNTAFAYIDKIPRVGPMGAGFLSKRSIAQFRIVYERSADDWIANYGIGMNYLHWPDYFKKTEGTLPYFEKCMELQRGQPLKPQYILTYLRMGDALVRDGHIDKAYDLWREGEKLFPGHPDIVDRLKVPQAEIADVIKQLYLPNNSIGAINTDISILWATTVPTAAVPLKRNALSQPGVGGQIKTAESKMVDADVGLFAWFTRNLPYLSDKGDFKKVDMSPLGAKKSSSDRLMNIVAHGMITGFLAEMDGAEPAKLRAQAAAADGFMRPFFHEGIGMAYAATVSLDDVSELKNMAKSMTAIDPHFKRLHLAGAGMWFGLESARDPEKVAQAFSYLGSFGEAYAYEGYGFSRTLFHYSTNPDMLNAGNLFRSSAAHNFYHGAGRALWILKGDDVKALRAVVDSIPKEYQNDAYSGYGMGVAFTKLDDPRFVSSFLESGKLDDSLRAPFVTGATMGFVIRAVSDPGYWNETLSKYSPTDRCRAKRMVALGEESLAMAEKGGGDLHSNWRGLIAKRVSDPSSGGDIARAACA